MGIGAPPASWVDSADGTKKSLQLLTRGNVGASAYCKEDGTGCIATPAMKRSHWELNTNNKVDIFNTNSSAKVGIGTAVPKGGPGEISLDVNGKVYMNELCMTVNALGGTQCAATWEGLAAILFQ